MTDAEKKMKKYTNAVERRLNLPRPVRERVMSDFISSIAARREAGSSDEEIYVELGDAKKAAADLNEQMKEFAYRKSPWRFLFLFLAVAAGAKLAGGGIVFLVGQYFLHRTGMIVQPVRESIGIIGGADGPTTVFLTTSFTTGMEYAALGLVLAVGILGFLRLRRCKGKGASTP